MNRSEFHKEVECNADYRGWHNAHELADKLFDAVQNRTCNKCQYNNICDIQDVIKSTSFAMLECADGDDYTRYKSIPSCNLFTKKIVA